MPNSEKITMGEPHPALDVIFNIYLYIQLIIMILGETEANRKPNENPYWHHFLRSVVDFDSQIKEKFNGRKSFSISTYGSLKYLTNQGGVYICY